MLVFNISCLFMCCGSLKICDGTCAIIYNMLGSGFETGIHILLISLKIYCCDQNTIVHTAVESQKAVTAYF